MRLAQRKYFVKLVFFVFSPVFIFSSLAAGQEASGGSVELDVEKAVSMAFEVSEELRISLNDILRQKSKHREERSAILPNVAAEVSWLNNFHYPNYGTGILINDYQLDSYVMVSQVLFTFGRVSNEIAAAQKAVEISALNTEGVRQDIIYNTKLAYYNAYLAEKALEIVENSYNNAIQNRDILERRTLGGRASKYNTIKASADVASRVPMVNNARADFLSAIETLRVTAGINEEYDIELREGFPQEFPEFQKEKLMEGLINNQPAIQAAAVSVKEKENLARARRSAFLPEASAFASWNYKGGSSECYVGGRHMDNYGFAGIRVSIPIWLGGFNRERLIQANIDKEDAEFRQQKIQKDYFLWLNKSIYEYSEHLETLKANQEAVRWAEESFLYSQELFASGQISLTDLNDAELQLANQKMNKEMTLFKLSILLAEIERLTLTENNYE